MKQYVQRCRTRVDENLERAPEDVVSMAIEHRQMHLETLAYMFHNFPMTRKRFRSPSAYRQAARPAPDERMA